jgi:heme oxygenase (biliverdin-IX-beta and delta-forming)
VRDQTSSARVPVLARLRDGTRDLHVAAESAMSYLAGTVDETGYRTFLERWYGFHVVLEPRLSAWHRREAVLDWDRRRKLPLLEADLGDLGVDRPARLGLPRCQGVPAVATTAEALGALYVVEGSTLGGLVLRDRLRDAPLPPGCFRFLSSYGSQTGRRWHGYRAAASAWVGVDDARADAVLSAARDAFTALVAWQTVELSS